MSLAPVDMAVRESAKSVSLAAVSSLHLDDSAVCESRIKWCRNQKIKEFVLYYFIVPSSDDVAGTAGGGLRRREGCKWKEILAGFFADRGGGDRSAGLVSDPCILHPTYFVVIL